MRDPGKPNIPGVSGMQGSGHLPAAERASARADRVERRKAADLRAAREEAERNGAAPPAKEPSAPKAGMFSRGSK